MSDKGSNISFGLSARFLFVVSGVAILSNIVLISAFLNFFPLHKIQTFFIQTEEISNKSIQIKPFKISKENKGLGLELMTSLVRQYVLERERFSTDYRFVENMWGAESSLRFMSSRKVHQDFMHSVIYKKVFQRGNPKRKSRFVELKLKQEGIQYHPHKKEWEITGKIIDYQEGATSKQVQDLRVILKADFSTHNQNRKYKDQFKNPFGFIVKDYKYLRQPSY